MTRAQVKAAYINGYILASQTLKANPKLNMLHIDNLADNYMKNFSKRLRRFYKKPIKK